MKVELPQEPQPTADDSKKFGQMHPSVQSPTFPVQVEKITSADVGVLNVAADGSMSVQAPFPKGVLRSYAYTRDAMDDVDFQVKFAKLPPQARLIVRAAEQLHNEQGPFTNKDLTDSTVKLGLQTRQLPERIIGYYLPRLRQEGFIT